MSIHKAQYDLGKKLGEAYLAAQGISLNASNKILEALDSATEYMKLGFTQIINSAFARKEIPYKIEL